MSVGTVVLHKPMRGTVQAATVLPPEREGMEYVRLQSLLTKKIFLAHPDDCVTCSTVAEAEQLARVVGGY